MTIGENSPLSNSEDLALLIADMNKRLADVERSVGRRVPWIDLSFSTGWSNYDGAHSSVSRDVQYRRVGDVVEMRGVAKPASSVTGGSGNYVIGVLPVGYRALRLSYTFATSIDGAPGLLGIDSGGNVGLAFGQVAASFAYLDSIRFSVL